MMMMMKNHNCEMKTKRKELFNFHSFSRIKSRRLQQIIHEFISHERAKRKDFDNLRIISATPETELLQFVVMHCIKLQATGRVLLTECTGLIAY
jgi:hypothetical protein